MNSKSDQVPEMDYIKLYSFSQNGVDDLDRVGKFSTNRFGQWPDPYALTP